MTQETLNTIKELRHSGITCREISKRLKIGTNTIAKARKLNYDIDAFNATKIRKPRGQYKRRNQRKDKYSEMLEKANELGFQNVAQYVNHLRS